MKLSLRGTLARGLCSPHSAHQRFIRENGCRVVSVGADTGVQHSHRHKRKARRARGEEREPRVLFLGQVSEDPLMAVICRNNPKPLAPINSSIIHTGLSSTHWKEWIHSRHGPPTSRPPGTWPSTPTQRTPSGEKESGHQHPKATHPWLLSREAGFLAPAVTSCPTLASTPA